MELIWHMSLLPNSAWKNKLSLTASVFSWKGSMHAHKKCGLQRVNLLSSRFELHLHTHTHTHLWDRASHQAAWAPFITAKSLVVIALSCHQRPKSKYASQVIASLSSPHGWNSSQLRQRHRFLPPPQQEIDQDAVQPRDGDAAAVSQTVMSNWWAAGFTVEPHAHRKQHVYYQYYPVDWWKASWEMRKIMDHYSGRGTFVFICILFVYLLSGQTPGTKNSFFRPDPHQDAHPEMF